MRARWARWSLSRRVVTAAAAALVVLLALGVVAFSWALDRILTQAATDAARIQADQLVAAVDAAQYTPAAAVTSLPARGSTVQLIDAAGRVVASSEPSLSSTPVTDQRVPVGSETVKRVFQIPDEQEPYAVVARGLAARDGRAYTLVVAAPLDVETRTVATSTGLLAGGSALLAGLLLFAVGRIVRGSLAPVERISNEVSRITRAGAVERVTVPDTGDEIATLAQTMNAMLERISRSDAASRRFVSDASHELRSPLATLRTHVETAEGSEEDARVDRPLMQQEILRLQGLVDDLLTLAKADDQGLALRRDEVDLDDVVYAEVRRLQAVAHGAVVRAHVEPALVVGDADRLAQVLRNLTENAMRHTTGDISLSMETDGQGRVLVHVDNDGDPIAADQREAVFDRFVRLSDSRARDGGGSGLGLAIARTFATAHGGTLTTGESPSGGCRFTLMLPVLSEAAGQVETERNR